MGAQLSLEAKAAVFNVLHDRMTECHYTEPLASFENDGPEVRLTEYVPVLSRGRAALAELNAKIGLGFDDWDLDFYTDMFVTQLQRDPTEVECFDLGQSNSEHSRHWFFGGKMAIDGVTKSQSLFAMVKSTLTDAVRGNSIIAFHDNSSVIRGLPTARLAPTRTLSLATTPGELTARPMALTAPELHPLLTAETHNFPTGVAPFAGAETGTGGRLRDVQATGRGAHCSVGLSAYCVGNLCIPGHHLPWEPTDALRQAGEWNYAANLASPLQIQIEASNGASDYGNKFGEPVVCGFSRSFGQRMAVGDGSAASRGERIEWVKPIMFTAGLGFLDGRHSTKGLPEEGMAVCKVGGPAYRIGMGGGAASSKALGESVEQGAASLDFNAVQRGDAQMGNRLNRVIRGCVELGDLNPIVSIHDQGAGGNGNVLKELVEPGGFGAAYDLRSVPTGDATLTAMEIWGAEYQENNAFLVRQRDLPVVQAIGRRENCPVSPVGVVTAGGRVVVRDLAPTAVAAGPGSAAFKPYDLPLSLVLGDMPQKTFVSNTSKQGALPPLDLQAVTVADALSRVLRLVDVGSKRFLTNKVDRSVSGLVAQQQCVGPLHMPCADVAVIASSHFALSGVAMACGEQPIKGLASPSAQV
jgi:phosphoribosylformylglycinamidine synthase